MDTEKKIYNIICFTTFSSILLILFENIDINIKILNIELNYRYTPNIISFIICCLIYYVKKNYYFYLFAFSLYIYIVSFIW